jgi:hypothetical protein
VALLKLYDIPPAVANYAADLAVARSTAADSPSLERSHTDAKQLGGKIFIQRQIWIAFD